MIIFCKSVKIKVQRQIFVFRKPAILFKIFYIYSSLFYMYIPSYEVGEPTIGHLLSEGHLL